MENIEKIDFKTAILSIGVIPASYVEAMSYYECMTWLLNFLQDVVIPVVNNNGQAVEELQALYVQLKTYVDTYFDSLDVQQEIDNKLDEMVEEGTLQEIITDYLNSKAIFAFDTVEDMKESTNLIDGSYAQTLGYYSVNDGGNSLYLISESEPDTYYETLNNGLYAKLIILNNDVNVKSFGAYGDNDHDDYSAINNAFKFLLNDVVSAPRNKTTKYILNFPKAIYKIKQANLLQGVNQTRVAYTLIKGNESILTFEDFEGICFNNFEILMCSEFQNLQFYSVDDDLDRTLFASYSTGGPQRLRFSTCVYRGYFDKVYNLTGNDNNSEFHWDYCSCTELSNWNSFLFVGDDGGDAFLNYWFDHLSYLAQGNFINMKKGGHIKLEYCDFSKFNPSSDTYLFKLGYKDDYGTGAFGSQTFIDIGSRYELLSAHSKVIDCYWNQAQVLFYGCDFSASTHIHIPSDRVYCFKTSAGSPIIRFEDCKLFGKLYTYSKTGSQNHMTIKDCIFYQVYETGTFKITDFYELERENQYGQYFNIQMENVRISNRPQLYNFTTNFMFTKDLTGVEHTYTTYTSIDGKAPLITNAIDIPIAEKCYVKSLTIIPYLNGNGYTRNLTFKSLISTVSSVDTLSIVIPSDDIDKFRTGQKLLINNIVFTISSVTRSSYTLTLTTDEVTPTITANDNIYLILATKTLTGSNNTATNQGETIDVNEMIYNDILMDVDTTASTKGFYGNLIVNYIA